MRKNIYISGMHSGQNPCAGIGIARSLRKAFPEIKIIGVDHWQGSSGLHHEAVDEVLLLPAWKQIDRNRHSDFLKNILDQGHVWISALDVEIYWLAQNFGTHPNLIVPTGSALEMTAKPDVCAMNSLGFKIPDHISAFLPDSDIHSFLRMNSWQCWLKGPYHEAKRINSWESFERHRDVMQKEWRTKRLFLQKNVVGSEESICFSAYQGRLLSVVDMQKRLITAEGKTWAGIVMAAVPDFFSNLSKEIKKLNWSGGGEIEFVRGSDGDKWMIECNPRFPAWIFGATLSGFNLPAKIISAIWNLSFTEVIKSYPCFTRVVHEIPAKESVGLPQPPDPTLAGWIMDGQKGKGSGPSTAASIPQLRDSMTLASTNVQEEKFNFDIPTAPEAYSQEIENKTDTFNGETPMRIHLESWTSSRFHSLANSIKSALPSPEIKIAYSVKTSSTDEHLRHARRCGFYAECISQKEISKAIQTGVSKDNIILNGPGKFWPTISAPITDIHMLFCDSINEFNRVIEIPSIAKVLGFRIQLPKLNSRFGISVDNIENFQALVNSVKKLNGVAELGFHFHMPSWAIGLQRWKEAIRSLLTWCQAIEKITSTPIRHLDLGGGFFPTDLEAITFKWVQEIVKKELPSVRVIYFEPGRALTQEGDAIVSRILDIRKSNSHEITEIVVDACIAELPMIHSYAHRVFYRSRSKQNISDRLIHLGKGKTKILGRICMENDILNKGLYIPDNAQLGDLLIFGDAGAYGRSMSYDFGRG